jgi:hypothetical protein
MRNEIGVTQHQYSTMWNAVFAVWKIAGVNPKGASGSEQAVPG